MSGKSDTTRVSRRRFLLSPAAFLAVPTFCQRIPQRAVVEAVLTRSEAAKRYHLVASRIGDLIVLGDRDTVFGELDSEFEQLPPNYRAHGSLHEMDVPLLIYNAQAKLSAESFRYNWELGRLVVRGIVRRSA
jgi:phosphonoacetate hydrolase